MLESLIGHEWFPVRSLPMPVHMSANAAPRLYQLKQNWIDRGVAVHAAYQTRALFIQGRQRSPQGILKAFFDRVAERGITLPNEQAQSRGISLCSGCNSSSCCCFCCHCCLLGTSCVFLFRDPQLVLAALQIDAA